MTKKHFIALARVIRDLPRDIRTSEHTTLIIDSLVFLLLLLLLLLPISYIVTQMSHVVYVLLR
jgi:hypothetical protein